MRKIPFKAAGNITLLIFSVLLIFHLTVIIGIAFFDFVPIDYLWGGKMETKQELLSFEILSLLVMLACIFLTLIKTSRLKLPKLTGVAHYGMWVLFLLFTLNTLGNLLAKTNFEKMFGVVTVILAITTLRLALEKRK